MRKTNENHLREKCQMLLPRVLLIVFYDVENLRTRKFITYANAADIKITTIAKRFSLQKNVLTDDYTDKSNVVHRICDDDVSCSEEEGCDTSFVLYPVKENFIIHFFVLK